MRAVLGWLIGCMLVRPGDRYVGVLVQEGNVPTRGLDSVQRLASQSADLGRLEGVLIRRSDSLPTTSHALAYLVGKAAKE